MLLGRGLRRSGGADVLHGPHYTLPPGSGLPGVVTVHDMTLLEHPEWHQRAKVVFFRRALRTVSRRAEVVVVPSEYVARGYLERFGSDRPVIHRNPARCGPCTLHSRGAHPGADEGALERLGIAWPYVLNVATSEPRKNRATLVAAFSKIAPGNPDLRLVLSGGGGWRNDALEAAIAKSPARDRIIRTGYLENEAIPALLRRAAVVAYPSWSEGFGLPALEAIATGAPLVTTTASAMSEVTLDTALLVAPEDVDGLAEALEAQLGGGPEVERRRLQGIQRAAGYTWEASAAAHHEAYVLARERASGGIRRSA